MPIQNSQLWHQKPVQQPMHGFGERRKVFNAGPNTASISSEEEPRAPANDPDAAGQTAEITDIGSRRTPEEQAEVRARLAARANNDNDTPPRKNVIPNFMGTNKSLPQNILTSPGVAIASGIGALNTGINITRSAISKLGLPIWSRSFGTKESRAEGAYGAIGNPFVYNIINNVKRAYGATVLGTHGVRNTAVGAVSGLAATAVSLPGTVAFGSRILTKPVSWLGKIPLLNKIPGYSTLLNTPDNIMQRTHNKIYGAAGSVYGWSGDNWKGLGSDIGGIVTNAKGAVGSVLETGRIGTAMISTDIDMAAGGALTKARKAIANSTVFQKLFGTQSLKDEMTFEA